MPRSGPGVDPLNTATRPRRTAGVAGTSELDRGFPMHRRSAESASPSGGTADPHGNAQYRNLRPSPSGTGRAAGTPVVASQKVIANGANHVFLFDLLHVFDGLIASLPFHVACDVALGVGIAVHAVSRKLLGGY